MTARYEQLAGDAEARTLDQITERLIVIDRTVAFIPANADRTLALEVRHPVLIDYFAVIFDRLWHLATPMHPQAATRADPGGITTRQRTIAALLVEGHTDAVIADRLGMNVRTARVLPHARIRSRGRCPHRRTGGHARQREPGAARLHHRTVGDS